MNGLITKVCDREETKSLCAGNVLRVSLMHVVCGATVIALVSLLAGSLMDTIEVDLGLHHYSESLSPLSTQLLPMPFNTVVNVGYVVVGVFWILRVRTLLVSDVVSVEAAYLMCVFAWMIVLYGPVQLVRIITQWRLAAILDQWYTLPIFAWVGISCQEIGRECGKIDVWSVRLIISASIASYGLAVLHTHGFEVALVAHIIGVIAQAWCIHQRSLAVAELDRQRRWAAFVQAVVCCVLFISLKLADWHLVRVLPVPFAVLSGHFWSKIADFMQAHYACQFLEAALPATARLHSEARSVCHQKHK